MPRRGENIYKRKDGRWEARYLKVGPPGKKPHYTSVYARTYSEVKRKQTQLRNSIQQEPEQEVADVLFSDILDLWLSLRKKQVKDSTYARYHTLVHNHIRPALGRMPLRELTTWQIDRYLSMLLTEGRMDGKGGLSPKSTADILCILKSVLEFARQSGHRVNCSLKSLSVRRQTPDIRVLTEDEQARLSHYLLEQPDRMKLGILLSLYTGIRVGELSALRWENLRTDTGVLQIRSTMQRIQCVDAQNGAKTRVIVSEPKSQNSRRDIPLPDFLVCLARSLSGQPGTYVLTGQTDRFVEPRTVQNRFKGYLKDCGIADANYHCLRHTFATRCIELGFDIKTLSEILGHANVNITLNRYVHSSMELKKRYMEKLTVIPVE